VRQFAPAPTASKAPQNLIQLSGETTPPGGRRDLRRIFGTTVRQGWLRLGAAALMLLAGSVPARAAWEVDWARVESSARTAAQRTEEELRRRQLPSEVAPALAATIRMTRNRAYSSGVRPIPAEVARALSPYFPAAMLNQVRWRPPMARPSMSGLLVHWYFREGAVTVHDVVLFSDERLAHDPNFWAHELIHVEQYRRYGVDGFARRYVSGWEKMEAEARQKAAKIRAEMKRRPVQGVGATGRWR